MNRIAAATLIAILSVGLVGGTAKIVGDAAHANIPAAEIVEVERIVEVPVIKTVTEYVEVPVEVIKDIVEVPVIKTVTEYVEVPVEVIKEVPVEVIRTEYVEVPTEVVKEVPVEVIVEVPTDNLPACLNDEVTDVNCIWDASTQGNGEGRSFIAYNGTAYYAE